MPSRSRSQHIFVLLLKKRPGKAIEMFDEALALNQNAAFTWALSALTLATSEELMKALERMQKCVRG